MAYIVPMRFEWDPEKDHANQSKHGLSFSEAAELLAGKSECLEIFDATHSIDEDRFISIGIIGRGVIVVVWTERDEDLTRIISARMATPREQRRYWQYMERLK